MTRWQIYKAFKESYEFLVNLQMDSVVDQEKILSFSECIANIQVFVSALSVDVDAYAINDVVALPYQQSLVDLINEKWISERKVSDLLASLKQCLEKMNDDNYSLASQVLFFFKRDCSQDFIFGFFERLK